MQKKMWMTNIKHTDSNMVDFKYFGFQTLIRHLEFTTLGGQMLTNVDKFYVGVSFFGKWTKQSQ